MVELFEFLYCSLGDSFIMFLMICFFGNICLIVIIKGLILCLFCKLIGILFIKMFLIVNVENLLEYFEVIMR